MATVISVRENFDRDGYLWSQESVRVVKHLVGWERGGDNLSNPNHREEVVLNFSGTEDETFTTGRSTYRDERGRLVNKKTTLTVTIDGIVQLNSQ